MIELVIAALLQIATITGDLSSTPAAEGGADAAPTTTNTVDGGTGTWDDNQ